MRLGWALSNHPAFPKHTEGLAEPTSKKLVINPFPWLTPDHDKAPLYPVAQGLRVLSNNRCFSAGSYFATSTFLTHLTPLQKELNSNTPHKMAFSQMCQTFFLTFVCSLCWEYCSLACLPTSLANSCTFFSLFFSETFPDPRLAQVLNVTEPCSCHDAFTLPIQPQRPSDSPLYS